MKTYPSVDSLRPDTSTVSRDSTLGPLSAVLECSVAPQLASFPEPILARCCLSGNSIGASSAREKRSDSRILSRSTLSTGTAGGKDFKKAEVDFFEPSVVSSSPRNHDGMKASSLDIGMDPMMTSDCMYLATMTSS